MSARLTQKPYFDARHPWVQSTNHIDPRGSYVDTFSSTSQLAAAELTGGWSFDAEAIWFPAIQRAYTTAVGFDISANTISLGRTTFGPEIGNRLPLSDKSVLEPFVGFNGVWDFLRTELPIAADARSAPKAFAGVSRPAFLQSSADSGFGATEQALGFGR